MEKITISSKIDSTFEFEMSAVNVDLDLGKAIFQTEISPGIKYDVDCVNESGHKWSVTIPKGLIPNGSYNFTLCVIADEYYFEPVKGKLSVVSAEIIEVAGVPVKTELQHPVDEPTDTVKPTIVQKPTTEGTSIVDQIKQKVAERQNSQPSKAEKYSFFKTDEQIKEEKFSKRKFDTIYPADQMPTKALPKADAIVEEVKPVDIEEVLTDKLDEFVSEKPDEVKQDEIFEEVTATIEEPVIAEVVEAEVEETVVQEKTTPVTEDTSQFSFFKPRTTPDLNETPDANSRAKSILSSLAEATITPTPIITIAPTGALPTGKDSTVFEELDEMRAINEKRRQRQKVKQIIEDSKKKD